MNEKQKMFFCELKRIAGEKTELSDVEMKKVAERLNTRVPWKLITPHETQKDIFDCAPIFEHVASDFKSYVPPAMPVRAPSVKAPAWQAPVATPVQEKTVSIGEVKADAPEGFYIPHTNPAFVQYGSMARVKKIINSRMFCPVYIFGETGLGKSLSVCQLSSKKKREVIRIAVNAHTNEEDFIGGFRLVDGETVWQDGPLVLAMKRGAILLIDEMTSLNPAYAFCLFGPLEGEPLIIKKTNKIVEPQPGFNIIATDNTRGSGSVNGRHVGVNVQNEALLDRFLVAVEYNYPTANQELSMLRHFSTDETVMKDLVKWANIIRNSYKDGAIDVTISPRRLISIMKINMVFNNLTESIESSISRYEEDTKEALLDFFQKIVHDPNYSNDDIFTETANESLT